MATTTNYSWTTPDDTALVKDGAAAIRSLGTAIDTTVFNNAGAAIAKTIVDAKGDLIVGTAADTVARLAVGGTNGHDLQVDSSTASGLKWDSVAAGGMTLINTGGTTLTGASVSISSIPSTYKNLQLVIQNARPATDNVYLNMRFNSDTGTSYRNFPAFDSTASAANSTVIYFSYQQSDNGASNSLAIVDILDYSNSSTWKLARTLTLVNNPTTPSTQLNLSNLPSVWYSNNAINEIILFPDSGNWTSGTAYLYGVK
jgi:hypothetical protein